MITSTSNSTRLQASENTPAIAVSSQAKTSSKSSAAVAPSDSVHLSDAAQAAALYHQGLNVIGISALLGVPDIAVDTYLNLNSTTGSVVIPPATVSSTGASLG